MDFIVIISSGTVIFCDVKTDCLYLSKWKRYSQKAARHFKTEQPVHVALAEEDGPLGQHQIRLSVG